MKRRRIKFAIGDCFLAPFSIDNADFSDLWEAQWLPRDGEDCFAMQIVGMSFDNPTVALYSGSHKYTKSFNFAQIFTDEQVIAIDKVTSEMFRGGSFKLVDRKLVPDSTPYMAYECYSARDRYIAPSNNANTLMRSDSLGVIDGVNILPVWGHSMTSNCLFDIANYMILDKIISWPIESLEKTSARIAVIPEAAVELFFPQAKDREWVREQIAKTGPAEFWE